MFKLFIFVFKFMAFQTHLKWGFTVKLSTNVCIICLCGGLLFTGSGSQNEERTEDNDPCRLDLHWASCNNSGS